MRKLLILAILLLVILLLATPLAQLPRHVDPASVRASAPEPAVLTEVYANLSSSLLKGDFVGSQQLLKLLFNVTAPPDLAFVLSRFHDLMNKSSGLLNASKTYIEGAKKLALKGDLKGAEAMLHEALSVLAKLNVTIPGLEDAAMEVERRLGARASLAASAVSKLLRNYTKDAGDVEARYILGLVETRIELSAEPERAWLGSIVNITGYLLNISGEPLAGRTVKVIAGGNVRSVITNESGAFSCKLEIPYVYTPSLSVEALYIPEGNDTKVYRPTSNSTTISLLYILPSLSVRAQPEEAHPGESVKVLVESGQPGLFLTISAFGESKEVVLWDSSAEIELKVPEDAAEGIYRIFVSSQPKGIVGPASAEASLNVTKLNFTKGELVVPNMILALVPATVTVRLLEAPPSAYIISVSLPGYSMQVNASGICTNLTLALPPLSPTGEEELKVSLLPLDPRFRPYHLSARVMILNPLLIASGLALVVLSSLYLRRISAPPKRVIARVEKKVEEKVEERAVVQRPPAKIDPVAAEYLLAVGAVERATGVKLKPSHTISEYLDAVREKLGDALQPFEELSQLTEARLYGAAEIDLSLARALREKVERLLVGKEVKKIMGEEI